MTSRSDEQFSDTVLILISHFPPFLSDGVRAPIPQKQEVLIQPGYEGYALNRNASQGRSSRVRSVFDGFRNFSNEARKFHFIFIFCIMISFNELVFLRKLRTKRKHITEG